MTRILVKLLILIFYLCSQIGCNGEKPCLGNFKAKFPLHHEDTLKFSTSCGREDDLKFIYDDPDSCLVKLGWKYSPPYHFTGSYPVNSTYQAFLVEFPSGNCGTGIAIVLWDPIENVIKISEQNLIDSGAEEYDYSASGPVTKSELIETAWIFDYDQDGDKDFMVASQTESCTAILNEGDSSPSNEKCITAPLNFSLFLWQETDFFPFEGTLPNEFISRFVSDKN